MDIGASECFNNLKNSSEPTSELLLWDVNLSKIIGREIAYESVFNFR